MKKTFIALGALLCSLLALVCYAGEANARLSRDIVRLHILAEDDSASAQKLKLAVRDRILEETAPLCSKEDIPAMLASYKRAAIQELRANGCDCDVSVEYGNFYFPTKNYGSLTYPAGNYDAVRIKIGAAKGQNWWCVLFPPLCYVNGSLSSDEAKSQLKEMLSPSDYELITCGTDGSPAIKVKFKTIEIINNLKEKISHANENKRASAATPG